MGVYELLRRRCKFIICVDGEADPNSTFQGQLTLVRHAQIDFGIRIDPRLDDVRRDPKSGFSRTHSQLFRVTYPVEAPDRPEAIGLMLYLKLSLAGNEADFLSATARSTRTSRTSRPWTDSSTRNSSRPTGSSASMSPREGSPRAYDWRS